MAETLEPLLGPVEIVTVKTSGDRGDRDQLGAFVKELQEHLLDSKVDAALHCLKDLPTQPVPGLTLAAYLTREDPRDTLLSKVGLENLPAGAVVGTGSLRRTAQLSAIRPDLQFKPLVGNIDTRMRKLVTGEYDAIVLAIAGLDRMNLIETWHDTEYASVKVERLDPATMLPAPGQAILVLECAEGEWVKPLSTLDDPASRGCAKAERSFLRSFGTGCSVPVGALAIPMDDGFELDGGVFGTNGKRSLRESAFGHDPEALGTALAQKLIGEGALDLLPEATAGIGGGQH